MEKIIEQENAMPEPERVIYLAAQAFSERQISIELGRSEDFVRRNYAKQIDEGRARGGATAKMVLFNKAMAGDHSCLVFS